MRALLQYHTRQLRQSPSTGIFLTCGWMTAILLTFIPGQFIAANAASLNALFTYLPWVMALLIPALTMPTATEGARAVTERLLTLPHTPAQRLFSRFAVLHLLLGIWILGFWPMVATVCYLGHPDFGPMLAGLFGTWLLAAPLLAVSLAVSLRAKSAVGGFLGSLALCLLLLLVGTNTVAGWFASVPGFGWLPSIGNLTLLGAYATFTSGLLNFAAILLMLGLTFFLLGFAIGPKSALATSRFTRHELAISASGAILVLLSLIPGFGYWQMDTTSDALHTPSPVTVSTLRELDTPVTFTLHLSQNNPDVPPAVHAAAHRLQSLLVRLRAAVPGKINVKLSNADASTAAAIAALQAGAAEIPLPTGTTYFAALTAKIADRTATLPQIDPARQAVQEYDLMALLTKAKFPRRPTVTILSSNPETAAPWQESLKDTFDFNHLAPVLATQIPSATNVLLLPDDPALPESALAAIRTYLARGGNVVLLADAFSRSAIATPAMEGERRFSSVLPEFGLTFVSDTLVADPTQATLTEQDRAGAMAYPYWLQLGSGNLDATLPFTTGIHRLFLPEAAPLELAPTASTTLTLSPVISTTRQARAVSLTTFQSTPPELALTSLPAQTGTYTLAAMASGAFTESATRTGNLLVVADADWLTPTALQQAPDNLTFLTNILHYFSGQSALTKLRAKGGTHTLTRVEDMANRLTRATAGTEKQIATELHALSQNPTAAAEKEFLLRQQLRDIRQRTRHSLQTLENALLLLNLALMPTATGIAFFLQRRRQRLKATSTL